MSCSLSHECRVMLIAELLTASTDATRGWLRAEMDRTVDPMLDSIFNRLKTKLTNVQIHQPSSSFHFNPQFVNMNYSYQQQQNVPNHSNSNPKLSSQSQPITIKKEIEQTQTHQIQSCSYAPVSNEQSNHNLTYQNWNNDEEGNSQINLLETEMQPQPHQFGHIKHNQFDDEECDCKECVDGGIEVKEDDEDDEEGQVDEDSFRPVKRSRINSTIPNNAQGEMIRQPNKDRPNAEGGHRMGSEQSEGINNRATIGHCSRDCSDESIVIQQEEMDATNSIGKESIATECTTNPFQANLVQTNRHLQCSHCQKSFDHMSKLERHLRVHSGERPFQCDQCDKRFNLKGNLSQHQLIHQNIKSFQCPECDKHFTQKNQLDFHLRMHSGERPFPCRHCEKSFTDLSSRKRHEQAIHLHVKPYRCKQCGHTATIQSHIITHVRTVHFGLPKTIKQQRALNIVDDRDARELVEKV